MSIMVIIGMVAGYQLNELKDSELIRFFPGEKEISIGEVEEALRYLDNKYLYEPDEEELTEDALQLIFSRLDPYSIYIPPSETERINNNMSGSYKGIGIETIILKDTLLITNVLDGSPAKRAGLEKLDRIIGLEGENFTGENLDFPQFRKHFQNQVDSSLLNILRKKSDEEIAVKLFAEEVQTKSINHYYPINDSTLYIRIDQFIAKTYREFMQILETHQKDEKIPQLVLDLRDNPGGYLGEVTKILSQFFDDSEKLLVKTQVRNGRERKYETTGRTFYDVGKIVVLLNEHSASGSEVLAGALQDWDRAVIIGKKSYGKGLVQEQYPLSNGGAVRITVANYFLPSGRSIQQGFELDSNYFESDSIWLNGKDKYTSLIHQRELDGASGIVPDEVISDSLYEHVLYPGFFADAELDVAVIEFIESNPEFFTLDESSFTTAFGREVILSEFGHFLEADNLYNEDILYTIISAKLAYFLLENQSMLKVLLEDDPYLLKAKEYFLKD